MVTSSFMGPSFMEPSSFMGPSFMEPSSFMVKLQLIMEYLLQLNQFQQLKKQIQLKFMVQRLELREFQ